MSLPTEFDTLSEFIDFLSRERGSSQNTVATYYYVLEAFLADVGERQVLKNEISLKRLKKHMAKVQPPGAAPASVANRIYTLRAFYKWLIQDCQLSIYNPAAALRIPRQRKRLPRCLHEDEIAKLIESCEINTFAGDRDASVIELLYGSGLRASEVSDLSLDDFDFEGLEVRVIGKGDKERIALLNQPTEDAIKRYLSRRRDAMPWLEKQSGLFVSS